MLLALQGASYEALDMMRPGAESCLSLAPPSPLHGGSWEPCIPFDL
jgi:hypothetical protein